MTLPTKALTIRQPWAWLIIHGPKRIENRSWPTSYRGRFAVHAAKGMTREEYRCAVDFAREEADYDGHIPAFEELQRGGIIGAANLVSCSATAQGFLDEDRWAIQGQYGFGLADVSALPFVPCAGALGWWNVPPAVLDQLRAEMERAA
jgi:hypothetical protein